MAHTDAMIPYGPNSDEFSDRLLLWFHHVLVRIRQLCATERRRQPCAPLPIPPFSGVRFCGLAENLTQAKVVHLLVVSVFFESKLVVHWISAEFLLILVSA